MKKFINFSLWNIEKIETFLHDMEMQGFRLVGVKFSHWFYFKKSTPKDVEYVVSYNLAKDNRKGMYEWQEKLLREHSAQEIPCINCDYHLYRITKQSDLTNFKNDRCGYIKHAIFQHLLMIMLFVIVALFLFITIMLGDNEIWSKLISGAFLFATLSAFFYILFGYKKQCKMVSEINKNK